MELRVFACPGRFWLSHRLVHPGLTDWEDGLNPNVDLWDLRRSVGGGGGRQRKDSLGVIAQYGVKTFDLTRSPFWIISQQHCLHSRPHTLQHCWRVPWSGMQFNLSDLPRVGPHTGRKVCEITDIRTTSASVPWRVLLQTYTIENLSRKRDPVAHLLLLFHGSSPAYTIRR